MGSGLVAELNSFEVEFTSAGNMRVDVRSKDHHGDLGYRDSACTVVGNGPAVGED